MTRRTPDPRPRTDSDDLADVLARRRRPTPVLDVVGDVERVASDPDAHEETARPRALPLPSAARRVTMARRSWYMAADVADELARAVDDLHFETRRAKHEVLAAVLRAGLDHLDDARHTLTS